MGKQSDQIDVKAAAEELDISVRRVQQFIANGRLPAQKFGGGYVIRRADLAKVKDRKPGRPKAQK